MTTYTADYLQIELDRIRERLLVALEYLPDEALLTPNTVGAWSVADLLVHLTVWEAELITGLMRIDQGRKPDKLLNALANVDTYNQRRYEENKGRDLDAVFDDFQKVRMQLESWLDEFSQSVLNNQKKYKWLKGKSLGQIIAQVTYENEAKYLADLERLAAQWETMEGESPQIVPLTTLDILEREEDE